MRICDGVAQVFESSGDGCRLRVKVVPGASRTRIVGVLGDRLKVAVAAPAEGGKANRAVCGLLADAITLAKSQVHVVSGQSQPAKTIQLDGIDVPTAIQRLGDIMRA